MKILIAVCLLLVTVAAGIYIWNSGFGDYLEMQVDKLSCTSIHNDCLRQSGVPTADGTFRLSSQQQKTFELCLDSKLNFEGGVRCGNVLGFAFLDTQKLL